MIQKRVKFITSLGAAVKCYRFVCRLACRLATELCNVQSICEVMQSGKFNTKIIYLNSACIQE